jgi:hypothetical protein
MASSSTTTSLPEMQSRKSIQTAKLVKVQVRQDMADAYKEEAHMLVKSRQRWKRGGDWCEAIAKGLTGVSTILAYAASAAEDGTTTDILAFVSGCVGTTGLVLLTYSSYATRESRQRTTELNGLLQKLGVTPMPEIAAADFAYSADDA